MPRRKIKQERALGRLSEAYVGYAPTLLRFLSFKLNNEADAQDLAQEAYLRLMRVKEPDMIQQPEAYLFRVTSNLISEFLINKNKRAADTDLDSAMAMGLDCDGDRFLRSTEAEMAIRHLDTILNRLPPLYKAVLLLRKHEGLSHQEIAERLEISTHTVHTYLTRAVTQCRAEWKE